ncbi:MAG: hypothetical protein GX939_04970 [Clostridiaceae bacterium]|nr:hypothetical protein [Clostridiaceae bacterium]
MSKEKHARRIVLVTLFFFAIVCPSLLLTACSGASKRVELPLLYGAVEKADTYDPDIYAPGLMSVIKSHLLTEVRLISDTSEEQASKKTVTLLASSYETPEKRGENGTKSTLFNASDQILYGRALVAMRNKRAFYKWMRDFDEAFWRDDSSFHDAWLRIEESDSTEWAKASSDPVILRGNVHWPVTLAYTRALLEAWRLWGGGELERSIMKASDALWPIFENKKTDQPFRAGAQLPLALDVWEEPWPLPDDDIVRMGTLLFEIDLWALLSLSRFEPKWAPVATYWIALTERANEDGNLPFMAPAVNATTQEYVVLRDGEQVIFLREQLIMALHLAEVGLSDDTFLSMIRSSLRDNKRLPIGWNVINSAPLAIEATPCEYALAMRLGRAVGDLQLIEDANEALLRHRVASQNSVIFGGLYRDGSTLYTNTLTAIDNAWGVLALR